MKSLKQILNESLDKQILPNEFKNNFNSFI